MISDEQLAVRAQAGDRRALELLVERYEAACAWVAAGYYDPSGDRDDLSQEARIGVLNAVRAYHLGRGGFRRFAFLCIRRQVITAVIAATKPRRAALTFAARVATNDEGDQVQAVDLLEAAHTDAGDLVAERDLVRAVVRAIRADLSPLERDWLVAVAFCGERYSGRGTSKSADNALQRARRKVARILEEAA